MAKMRDLGFFLWRQATNVVATDRSAFETAVYVFPSRFMQCQFHILRHPCGLKYTGFAWTHQVPFIRVWRMVILGQKFADNDASP
jgi:hypothetical protein